MNLTTRADSTKSEAVYSQQDLAKPVGEPHHLASQGKLASPITWLRKVLLTSQVPLASHGPLLWLVSQNVTYNMVNQLPLDLGFASDKKSKLIINFYPADGQSLLVTTWQSKS